MAQVKFVTVSAGCSVIGTVYVSDVFCEIVYRLIASRRLATINFYMFNIYHFTIIILYENIINKCKSKGYFCDIVSEELQIFHICFFHVSSTISYFCQVATPHYVTIAS